MKRQLAFRSFSLALATAGFAVCAETQSDAFYAAIRTNDLARLSDLVKQGGANAADDHGVTPLMYAAAAGSVDAMRLLIDKGAGVNAKNVFGSTALMWSATDIRKVRLLVEHGADVNAVSKRNRSALLLAALSNPSAEIVRFLIGKGADPKAADVFGLTTLNAAAMGNDLESVKLLIDAGVDVNAAAGVQGPLAELGESPLLSAAFNGNLAAVKLLLSKGANVNFASSREKLFQVKNGPIILGGFTPLLLAAAFGPPDLVRALIDAGADVNAKDVRGMTPLMLAVGTDRSNPEIIRMLLAKGADVKVKSNLGETALDWARKVGCASAFDTLKQAGAVETGAEVTKVSASAPVDLKPAVERSIALLEKTTAQFFVNGGCVACHAQNMTDMAVSVARAKGIHWDEKAAEERTKMVKAIYGPAGPMLLERMDAPGSPDTPAYSLAALAATGYRPDRMTDAVAADIAALQWSDGRWHYGALGRPPLEDGDIFRTAIGIRALKVYGPPGRGPEMQARIAKAGEWLLTASPVNNEDRNMQLLGLFWAGSKEGALRKIAGTILAAQRSDGGWSQRAELDSDAYATGESLYALAQTGMIAPSDPAYRKGVKYLLSTQHADGSWYVRSRAPKFQPYFESSFPYGHDQWISETATAWATMGLAMALEDAPGKAQVASR